MKIVSAAAWIRFVHTFGVVCHWIQHGYGQNIQPQPGRVQKNNKWMFHLSNKTALTSWTAKPIIIMPGYLIYFLEATNHTKLSFSHLKFDELKNQKKIHKHPEVKLSWMSTERTAPHC